MRGERRKQEEEGGEVRFQQNYGKSNKLAIIIMLTIKRVIVSE